MNPMRLKNRAHAADRYPRLPQLWCEEARDVMASGPYSSRMRFISPETRSSASSQLMRS